MPSQLVRLVRAGVLVPIIDFINDTRAVERFLETVRLSPTLVGYPDELMPWAQACAFVETAARSVGTEEFGLLAGDSARILSLGALGQALQYGTTLYEALKILTRACVFYNSAERLWLTRRDQDVVFSHKFNCGDLPGRRHADAFTLMLMIDLVRLSGGRDWKPKRIHLPAVEVVRKRAYEAFFGIDIEFKDDAWGFVFEQSLLTHAFRSHGPSFLSHPNPLVFLKSSAPATDFAGSIRQAIASLLRSGHPHIGLVADFAGLSVRTFQRCLTEAGVSYSRLIEQARFDLARQLLQQGDNRVIDVALELGYTSPFNFTRAFRRWAGMSPREFRRQHARGASSA